MAVWFLRAFFLLVSAGAGWQASRLTAILVLELVFTEKQSLANLLAVVFGVGVGILLANLAFYITTLILPTEVANDPNSTAAIRIILTVMLCYLSTMIVFRTRDRFRFVIPYVEIKREQKGPRALILDTSAIIDDFVLEELHSIADSADRLKRVRGRRGLELINQLKRARGVDITIYETGSDLQGPVDSRLVHLARELDAHICTTDFNLNKVAEAQGVAVLNINELANALKPSVIPGEILSVKLVRRGEEPGQGVGFLDDGTMVVVEGAEDRVGEDVAVEIARVLQRSSGRIIFGRPVS